jgi:trehalose/maltose hydrolase-like predicted phosphorylase
MLDVTIDDDVHTRRKSESLLALCDGSVSAVGALHGTSESRRIVLASGSYGCSVDGSVRLLPGPNWLVVDNTRMPTSDWRLDLRSGVLEHGSGAGPTRIMRFQSAARPGIGVEQILNPRLPLPATQVEAPDDLGPHAAQFTFEGHSTTSDGVAVGATVSDRAAITVALADRLCAHGPKRTLERYAAVRAGRAPAWGDAIEAVAAARSLGFDALLAEQKAEWRKRWDSADIRIVGDPAAQLAIRFALFHLLSCAAVRGESAVGARGLTGLAYGGHVFWDTDVFVLPALAAVMPGAARSILEYRATRIPAARSAAADRGLPGLRFPWESADDGVDVTPTHAVDVEGTTVPIVTGQIAEHINSDIAWSLLHYVSWTGDVELLDGFGREIVMGTAEYFAGRCRVDESGIAHIDDVVGPDEYHEGVDDNAYTNGLLRWHFMAAAALARTSTERSAARRFRQLAGQLATGYDRRTGCHEQFARFWQLDDVRIGDLASTPVAADVLLGRARVAASQVIKQPDVLMLHHLVPDQCPPGSLSADLRYYLPRTAHGSSLSPAICAALLARDGRPDEALEMFRIAARIDLDDLTGTTGGGLHFATMGGLWQAVVWGFAGIRPGPSGLHINPCLPTSWDHLGVSVAYRGVRLRVEIDHEHIAVEAESPVAVIIDGRHLVAPLRMRRHVPELLQS